MNKTQPARGMRDFLPIDVRRREYVIGVIREVYESYGFEPLETPAIENLETLTGKYGEEGGQLMFKILKRGEKLDISAGEKGLSDLALRYDLTVPLARVVANYRNDLPKFFKRYQIQPVWRADRPARGRYREFYQCDVDAIGSKSMIVEAELISAVSEILQRLGFDDFVIKLNHRNLLFDILERANIPTEKQADAVTAIDKLDKLSVEQVSNELINKGITESSTAYVMNLYKEVAQVWNQGIDVNEILLSTILGGELEIREQLIKIINLVGNSRIAIYPFLARGLSYYTGTIMEINVPDLAGSLGGGGRYDELIGMFGKEQIPACGFSLGLERILVVMEERGMFPEDLQNTSADVMVTIWNEESAGESLKLANELRKEGLRVLVYPEADKLGKQFKYASQVGVSFVCVMGESELAENKVTLKNMRSGEQETLSRAEIAAKIKV
ncbi:MAG TPA: histidine--tRNA ligase [Pyrinomonadaceae bacterium]|jgi:histidyl-tRNA synthetase